MPHLRTASKSENVGLRFESIWRVSSPTVCCFLPSLPEKNLHHSSRDVTEPRSQVTAGCFLFLFQITGGSSGIGKELAAEAIRRGAEAVTIVARTEVDTQSTCKLACVHSSCQKT